MRRFTSGPKPCPRVALYVDQQIAAIDAQAVTHAVEARQIGRCFRGRKEIIHRQTKIGVRQRDFANFCAERLHHVNRLVNGLFDFRLHAVDEVFLRHADANTLQIRSEMRGVVGHLDRHGG